MHTRMILGSRQMAFPLQLEYVYTLFMSVLQYEIIPSARLLLALALAFAFSRPLKLTTSSRRIHLLQSRLSSSQYSRGKGNAHQRARSCSRLVQVPVGIVTLHRFRSVKVVFPVYPVARAVK